MCGTEAFLHATLIRHAVMNSGMGKGVPLRDLLPASMHWILGRPPASAADMQAGFDAL